MPQSRYADQIRDVLQSRQEEMAIDFDGVAFTWGEANAVARAVEKILDDTALPAFGRVGLIGRNRPAHFAALWGTFIGNRCTSMVNAFQSAEALAEDMTTNRWPIILGEPREWNEIVIAAADAAGCVGYVFTGDPAQPLARVTRLEKPAAETNISPEDDTVIQLLSSGTTGKPKRISLALKSIDEMISRTRFMFESSGSGENAAQIMPWPLSSLGGTNAALPAVSLGQTLAIQEKFDAVRFLGQLRRYRPTFLSVPPAAIAMVLQLNPSREDFANVQLYFNGSAPIDPNVRSILEDEYGLMVCNAYGATEFAGIISSWVPEDLALLRAKRGSCGRALPGFEMRIVSPETGAVLPPRETGLVEALTPHVADEWIRTNDLAYMDEDGFLFLEGRADDAIIRGGFKVIPEEVAEVLRTHPKVGDAALIGLADERLGMVPAAVIEKRLDGEAPTAEELDAFLRTKLPRYKVPVRYAIVAAIPRTQTMKPRREGLRALFK